MDSWTLSLQSKLKLIDSVWLEDLGGTTQMFMLVLCKHFAKRQWSCANCILGVWYCSCLPGMSARFAKIPQALPIALARQFLRFACLFFRGNLIRLSVQMRTSPIKFLLGSWEAMELEFSWILWQGGLFCVAASAATCLLNGCFAGGTSVLVLSNIYTEHIIHTTNDMWDIHISKLDFGKLCRESMILGLQVIKNWDFAQQVDDAEETQADYSHCCLMHQRLYGMVHIRHILPNFRGLFHRCSCLFRQGKALLPFIFWLIVYSQYDAYVKQVTGRRLHQGDLEAQRGFFV